MHPASINATRMTSQGGRNGPVLMVCLPNFPYEALEPDLYLPVQSGKAALELLGLLNFSWMITSLDVPDLTPWELLEQARLIHPWVRLVVIDSNMSFELEVKARQLGASTFPAIDSGLIEALTNGVTQDQSVAPAS